MDLKEKVKDLLFSSPIGSYERMVLNSILGEITSLKLGRTPEAVLESMLRANMASPRNIDDNERERIRKEATIIRSLIDES